MSRTLTIILFISCIGVGVYAFTVFHARESDLISTPETSQNNTTKNENISTNTPPQNNASNESSVSDMPTNTQSEDADQATNNTTNNSYYVHVTSTDCARECEPYKYDDKELAYCQNVCGISTDSSHNNCEDLKDLKKDYCYKDQAIDKKDASICDKISDTAIKKTCKNRIQEDVLENM